MIVGVKVELVTIRPADPPYRQVELGEQVRPLSWREGRSLYVREIRVGGLRRGGSRAVFAPTITAVVRKA